jgi:hypothetical protein
LLNNHNSDLYSDLDTGPDHQRTTIKVFKKEQNFNIFFTVQSLIRKLPKNGEAEYMQAFSEQQGMVQNERRDAEMMTRVAKGTGKRSGASRDT